MLTAKITGDKNVIANMERYSKNMDLGTQAAMERVVELITAKAKSLAPVDTGKLRSSVEGVVRKMTNDIIGGHVEATVQYAEYLEFGTSKQKAQPFLTPAIEEGLKLLETELQRAHNRAAGKLRK